MGRRGVAIARAAVWDEEQRGMLSLERLTLTDFRNYARLSWQPGGRLAVITGPNGSGKTNLLEAVSLLAPGRGLRGAKVASLARNGGPGTWAVAARLADAEGPFELGTGTVPGALERRSFRLDGVEPRTQAEVGLRVGTVWITPQMDFLFQESASGRRRFLDRLVWALEPGHAREASAYEQAMASRNRLLAEGRADPAWLAGLEDAMARHATALAAARASYIHRLNTAELPESGFPRPHLTLIDPVAARLAHEPALAVETALREALGRNRGVDAAAGGATLGAHKADLALQDAATGVNAAQASTGQQKTMLIGIILAHASLVAQMRPVSPILLLDEPTTHLDAGRREALCHYLTTLPGPALLTGTDPEHFSALQGVASFHATQGG